MVLPFRRWKAEAQKQKLIWLKLSNSRVMKPEFKPKQSCSWACGLTTAPFTSQVPETVTQTRLRARCPGHKNSSTPSPGQVCHPHLCAVLVPDGAYKIQSGEIPVFCMQKWEGCDGFIFYNSHAPYFKSEEVTKINVCVKWKQDSHSWGIF